MAPSKFQLETNGMCLICLQKCSSSEERINSAQEKKASLQTLLYYLKIDIAKYISTILDRYATINQEDFQEIECTFCTDCFTVYMELEDIHRKQNQLNQVFQTMYQNVGKSRKHIPEYKRSLENIQKKGFFHQPIIDHIRRSILDNFAPSQEDDNKRIPTSTTNASTSCSQETIVQSEPTTPSTHDVNLGGNAPPEPDAPKSDEVRSSLSNALSVITKHVKVTLSPLSHSLINSATNKEEICPKKSRLSTQNDRPISPKSEHSGSSKTSVVFKTDTNRTLEPSKPNSTPTFAPTPKTESDSTVATFPAVNLNNHFPMELASTSLSSVPVFSETSIPRDECSKIDCTNCKYTYGSWERYLNHAVTCTPVICNLCGKRITGRNRGLLLRNHVKGHTKQEYLKKLPAGSTSSKFFAVLEYIRITQCVSVRVGNSKGIFYKCCYCAFMINQPKKLEKHMMKIHFKEVVARYLVPKNPIGGLESRAARPALSQHPGPSQTPQSPPNDRDGMQSRENEPVFSGSSSSNEDEEVD